MNATVVLTGFEPFGGEDRNASWEAVRLLDGAVLSGARVVAVQLPCVFGAAREVLDAAIDAHAPALVVAVGQASNRAEICVERVAINLDDARIPDNAGAQPIDRAIDEAGPAAYLSRLPAKAMVAAMLEAGVPAKLSETAGTYVCNHVFYGLLHRIAMRTPALRGGFIHVPSLATMEAERIAAGLRAALAAALKTG